MDTTLEVRPDLGGADFTCPMHPQVRRKMAGLCPICGMALEPVLASPSPAPNAELGDMTRRFWLGLVLALPVFGLEMGGHLFAIVHSSVPERISNWIQFGLATPVVFWAGAPFFARAWASLVSRHLNMFTLAAMGTGVGWTYSVVALLWPGLFPAASQVMGAVPVYFESAAVITVLVLLGQVLELRAREQTSGAIKALLTLSPKTARRLGAGGLEADVALDSLRVGDLLRVRPGETVPVDGLVESGSASLDQAMITGESMPVDKTVGERVIGGTLNRSGALIIRAEKVGSNTLLARIVQRVGEAQRSRAPIQNLADSVAAWFVPAVITIAVLTFAGWAAFGPTPRIANSLLAAVSVLIIACPCALGLATPMSILVGIGRGARLGILVKNAGALQRLETVDTLMVDKTGTLTEGRPSVTEIVLAADFGEADVLQLAAAVERASEHPIARAIVAAAEARVLAPLSVTNFAALSGKGTRGVVDGKLVRIGTAAFLEAEGVVGSGLLSKAEGLREDGSTVIYVAIDNRVAALVALSDKIRGSTSSALTALRKSGLRILMVSGDNKITAHAIACKLGITEVNADVLPEQKGDIVRKLQGQGRIVAMVGDGVNDAPALAIADVGIAMGSGADVAIESAGITLLGGDLAGLVRARRLSQATMWNIRENLDLCVHLQCCGPADRRGDPVSRLRQRAVAHLGGRRDGVVIGQRDFQCTATLPGQALGRSTAPARSRANIVQGFECLQKDARVELAPADLRRFAVQPEQGVDAGLGRAAQVFHREDHVIGEFAELTNQRQVIIAARDDLGPAQELAGDEGHHAWGCRYRSGRGQVSIVSFHASVSCVTVRLSSSVAIEAKRSKVVAVLAFEHPPAPQHIALIGGA